LAQFGSLFWLIMSHDDCRFAIADLRLKSPVASSALHSAIGNRKSQIGKAISRPE
jgi:hypothetical protein